jgi:hypothetical protein
MDMTILVPSCPTVNQLHIKIKFDTFEQLMLHDDFCAFSFSELLDWIKPCVEITWKTWRTKEIDWGLRMTNLVSDSQTHKSPSRFWSAEMKVVTKVRSVGKSMS